MLAYHDFAPEYKKFISSKCSDIYQKAVASERDSGFEDLIEYVKGDAILLNENTNSAKTTASTATSNAKPPTNKRRVGRPPKRHDTEFECDLCDFTTAYATYFRAHLSQAHPEERLMRIFKCPHSHCMEAYVEERFLREHIRHIHESIQKRPKFICDECGKGFPKESHLKRHSYVHNPDEKPFLCEHCPRRFPSQSSLQRHIEGIHVAQKPHKCEVCGKAFGHIYGLKAHKIRLH